MTETRPVQTPPPQVPPAKTPDTPPPPPNAAIESLPRDIDDVTTLLKIRGEVFQSRADGVVRILTDKGEITVRLDPRETPPPNGRTVEIQIYPGKPPTTARVSPEAPPAPALRTIETPVDITLRPPQDPEPASAPPQKNPDIPVRLEPVSYDTIKPYIQDPVETLVTATTQTVQQKIQIIAQNVINESSDFVQTFPAPTAPVTTAILQDEEVFQPAAPQILSAIEKTAFTVQANTYNPSPAPQNSSFTEKTTWMEGQRVKDNNNLTNLSSNNPLQTLNQIQIDEFDLARPAPLSLLKSVKQFFTARIASVPEQSIQLLATPEKPSAILNNSPQLILNNQKAGTLTATVVAHTPQNLPVIALFQNPAAPSLESASFFVLHAPALSVSQFIPGTEIALIPHDDGLMTLAPPSASQTGFVSAQLAPPLTPFAPQPWPVMNDILDALNDVSLPSAQAFSNIMATPARPADIPPAALFFIAALRGGDLASWIGERITDALKRAGREGLITRLAGEGAALNRAENFSGEWRGVSVPLYMDNQIHKLALYYKHERDSNPDAPEGGKMVRFIFDMALDAMGKVQLDGLFRSNKLDLIVRSEAPFSTAMQNQMRAAYVAALEPTEVRGELSFQNKPEQWVTIKADRAKFGTEV